MATPSSVTVSPTSDPAAITLTLNPEPNPKGGSPAAGHGADGLVAALGVQVEQHPHLPAHLAAAGDGGHALHRVRHQRLHLAAAVAGAERAGAGAGVDEQGHGALQLLVALAPLRVRQPHLRLVGLDHVGLREGTSCERVSATSSSSKG